MKYVDESRIRQDKLELYKEYLNGKAPTFEKIELLHFFAIQGIDVIVPEQDNQYFPKTIKDNIELGGPATDNEHFAYQWAFNRAFILLDI